MTKTPDDIFSQSRRETWERIAALIDARIAALPVGILLNPDDLSLDASRNSAARECWTLLKAGVLHLKSGAPSGKEGSMAGALTRASLRSSALAAALGIKKPQFEQMFFSVDGYSTGQEAALFLCRRLVEAAEADLDASRRKIGKVVREENAADMKQQIAFSFQMLAGIYGGVCRDMREMLDGFTPPAPQKKTTPKPKI